MSPAIQAIEKVFAIRWLFTESPYGTTLNRKSSRKDGPMLTKEVFDRVYELSCSGLTVHRIMSVTGYTEYQVKEARKNRPFK